MIHSGIFFCSPLQASKLNGGTDISKTTGTLLYHIATKLKNKKRLNFLLNYVVSGKIASEPQLSGKFTFRKVSKVKGKLGGDTFQCIQMCPSPFH